MSREKFFAAIITTTLRLLFLTLRLRVDDRIGLGSGLPEGPVILCFWHNRILGITQVFLQRYPHRLRPGVTVLTSPSRDGELLARCMDGFGMGSVRGSSSRRGSQAMRELVKLVETGRDVAITPDGPRGPCYQFGPGAIFLSQVTGAPLVPMQARFSRCIRLKTWDGFIIPLPFSTVSITVHEMIPVPREPTTAEFQTIRTQIESLLKVSTETITAS